MSLRNLPTTAAPSPAEFEATYTGLIEQGATQILSIHISGELSSTYSNAELAAAESRSQNGEIEVFDSRQLSAATALSVEIAAKLAAERWSIERIKEHLQQISENIGLIAALDKTENAKKGGRINSLVSTLATLLNIKPILRTINGRMEEEEKKELEELSLYTPTYRNKQRNLRKKLKKPLENKLISKLQKLAMLLAFKQEKERWDLHGCSKRFDGCKQAPARMAGAYEKLY